MSGSRKHADHVLFVYFLILLFFGLLMLTSASAPIAHDKFGDKYFFVKRQLLVGLLPGLLAFFVLAKVRISFIKKSVIPVFALSIILLILAFIPGIGSTLGTGANSWILFGGYSFQPAEFAKLGVVLIMSFYLSRLGKRLHNFKDGFLLALGVGMIPVFLVLAQPDVGTGFILFAIVFGMLFLGYAKMSHMWALLGSGVVAFALMIVIAPYRAARFTTFLHPELDPLGVGYHINQAFLAIGSGGLFGLGLGHSRQKFEYLPEVHADSIYAVIAEEMGLIVAAGLVLLLVLIATRGLMIARNSKDNFSRLLASGIVIWFVVQSFMNIGAMVGILPLTGVPLPFVSHGGTALVLALAGAGLLLNISKES